MDRSVAGVSQAVSDAHAPAEVSRQRCSTHNRDIGIVSRFVNGRRKRSAIATGQEKALTLRGVLLEYLHRRKVDIEPVGATQLPGQVIRGHAIQHVVDLGGRGCVLDIVCPQGRHILRRRTFINQHAAQPRRHGNRHFNVPRDLEGIIEVTRVINVINVRVIAAGTVNQNRLHVDVGRDAGLVFVVLNVLRGETEKFKKPDRLSGAVLRNAGGVSIAEIIALEGAGVAATATAAAATRRRPMAGFSAGETCPTGCICGRGFT